MTAFVPDTDGSRPRIAVVLPGGGSRGAYEAGALSVLLPALEARGERVSIVCGTSVGAINAALVASLADRPAAEVAAAIVDRWTGIRKNDVIRSIVGPGLPLTVARLVGEVVGIPGMRSPSLLDASPLRANLEEWIDWTALHRNVRLGAVDAVCVVATALAAGRPVAFAHARRPLPAATKGSARMRYVRTTLAAEHVRASAAIPVLFPPVEVTTPKSAAGHYIDGATRLNFPLKPAIALGADRLILVGLEPLAKKVPEPAADGAPRIAEVLANVLDGLLVDKVSDDLHRLAAINAFLVDGAAGAGSAVRSYRRARGHDSYRRIAYALVAPERRGELGETAERVYRERYGGLRALLDPDYPLLSRLLGGGTPSRGELLSFLLFDEHFIAELVAHGARDAQRWVDRHPRFWCSDPTHDLGLDPGAFAAAREEQALSEWRSLRRG